jgi:transposase
MTIICGVDVSSTHLDARIGHEGAYRRFERNPAGIGALAGFCREHEVGLVVFEATGGYEKLPFGLLWHEGIACAVVNARAVRDFARALGYLEKTDRIDAGVIARFAEVRAVEPQPPATDGQARLRALVGRLRQLIAISAAEKNRGRLVTEAEVQDSLGRTRAFLTAEIRRLEGEIASTIDDDPLWKKLDASFREIKGVAGRTVATIAAIFPEVGTLDGKAAAKLNGLAPLADDSGTRSGERSIRGGRQFVRDILFMVAHVVCLHNDDFREFADRLKALGKPKKVIRVALARKLLVRLNAKARDARRELAMTT